MPNSHIWEIKLKNDFNLEIEDANYKCKYLWCYNITNSWHLFPALLDMSQIFNSLYIDCLKDPQKILQDGNYFDNVNNGSEINLMNECDIHFMNSILTSLKLYL